MINRENPRQLSIEEFRHPFGTKLDGNNRWVKLADVMPWEVLSEIYNAALSVSSGRPALSARVVVGALIIKHMLSLTDEETIAQIKENPYLQYFLGYSCYSYENEFEPSLFVTIRKRLGEESIKSMNELFVKYTKRPPRGGTPSVSDDRADSQERADVTPDGEERPANQGMLLLDATVAPADITYPTDLELLNQGREESERLIDALYEPAAGKVKPRTYRRKARRNYLSAAKKRNRSLNEIQQAISSQLGFLGRNLRTIERLLDERRESYFPLPFKDQRRYWVIQEVYRQQEQMSRMNEHRIEGRIVSIAQPHVRPIVRGKAKAKVEFGAKLSASVVNGNVFLDRIGWDAFNEGGDLPTQVKNYRERFGFYPEVVIADTIYRNRENRAYLKERGIRCSGAPLGRPPADPTVYLDKKKQLKKESGIRNRIEGAFGVGKRRFSLDLVMAKLKKTSESWIAMVFFVMNIAHWLRDILFSFLTMLQNCFLGDNCAFHELHFLNKSRLYPACIIFASLF